MARENPTAIDKLDVEHPGLKLDVNTWFDGHAKLSDVAAWLKDKYGVRIPESTLSYYQHHRWWPALLRIRAMKERVLAIREALAESPEELGDAIVMEKLAEASMDEVSPVTLLREERERRKLKIEEGRLEVAVRQAQVEEDKLKLEIARLEQEAEERKRRLEEATNEAVERAAQGQSITREDINRIRERVFGLPPAGGGAAPAVSAEVGG